VGAIGVAAPAHSRKAHSHGREKEELFYILTVISLVGTISGKSLKLLQLNAIF